MLIPFFPQIYENDPLPKGLCEGCELFVYATYEKLVEFNRAQQELVTREIDVEEDADYLKAFNAISTLLDRIQNIKDDLLSKSKQSIAQMYKSIDVKKTRNANLRFLLLKESKVKTLKRLCIDYFNEHGPDLVETYLKCEWPPVVDDEEESEEEIRNTKVRIRNPNSKKRGNNRRRMGYRSFGSRKKKRSGSVPSVKVTSESIKPKKVAPKAPTVVQESDPNPNPNPNNQEEGPATRRRSRALSRVNYVDDIPDSVLFYDEIQEAKRRKMEEKVILESIKEASKQQQPSPCPPLVPPLVIRVTQLFKSNEPVVQQGLFNTNPESEIKINSAMSVQPMIEDVAAMNNGFGDLEQIPDLNVLTESQLIPLYGPELTDPNRLFSESDLLPPELVDIKSECPNCGLICDNLKILAMHNMEHLSLRLRRVGEKESLPASLRRGVMVMEGGFRFVRCSNCLKTFMNADQIKQHWKTLNCEYFCKICYLSFHRNPERMKDHMLSVHGIRTGIRQRKMSNAVKPEPQPLELLENMTFDRLTSMVKPELEMQETSSSGSSGGFKLKVKSVSMINASASGLNVPVPDPVPYHHTSEVSEMPPLHYPTQVIRTNQFNMNHQFQHQIQPPPILPQLASQRAVCHICHCSFPNTNSRNSHMKVHKRFPESSGPSRPPPLALPMIPNPMNDFTVKVNFAVRPCGFRYYNRVEFIQHRSECKDCRYACTMCVKTFQSGSELQMHLMLEHPRSLTFKR